MLKNSPMFHAYQEYLGILADQLIFWSKIRANIETHGLVMPWDIIRCICKVEILQNEIDLIQNELDHAN